MGDQSISRHKKSKSDTTSEGAIRSSRKQSRIQHNNGSTATRRSAPITLLSRAATQEEFALHGNPQALERDSDITFKKETPGERLERNRSFYNNRPLMWGPDTDGGVLERYVNDLLFDRLFDEVHHGLNEIMLPGIRSLAIARTYWDNVRRQLRHDNPEVDFKYQGCNEKCLIPAKKINQANPKLKATVWSKSNNGKDPYLQEVRKLLTGSKTPPSED